MSKRSRARIPPPETPANLERVLSESDSHREHRIALEATLFQPASDVGETVLELSHGRLRLRTREI